MTKLDDLLPVLIFIFKLVLAVCIADMENTAIKRKHILYSHRPDILEVADILIIDRVFIDVDAYLLSYFLVCIREFIFYH